MANCTMCTKFGECPWQTNPNSYCSAYEQRAMTNADRIRSMSDEELATFLYHAWNNASWCMVKDHCPDEDSCFPCWLDWLKLECE